MLERIVEARDYVTKSNLPACDYVINPYTGCPHACKYCYACFMKRFTGHREEWGEFLDIKVCEKPIRRKAIMGKSVFLSSVTDCYNKYEETYRVTRGVLEQLVSINCEIGISTKSALILRDLDLLRECGQLKVSISINTLDEEFRKDMDRADSIKDRLAALEELHRQGIYTILFLSPIFPFLTDYQAIIEKSRPYVDEYWFENLNLRGGSKKTILDYIAGAYPEHRGDYADIYEKGDKSYWRLLSQEIEAYCGRQGVRYQNYFYHEQLVKNGRGMRKAETEVSAAKAP